MADSCHRPLSWASAACASDRKDSTYSGMAQRSNIACVIAIDDV